MDTKEIIAIMKNSPVFNGAIVKFIPEILELYFNDKLSREDFPRIFVSVMNKRKFYLSVLPQEKIDNYKKLYLKEFILADKLNKIALKNQEFDDEAFKKAIQDCIEEYLNKQ